MTKFRYISLLIVLGLTLGLTLESCSATGRRKKSHKPKVTQVNTKTTIPATTPGAPWNDRVNELIAYGETLLGKPYRYRGNSPWAMDCSGYVSFLYSRLGIKIPRSSRGLSKYVDRIVDARPGDLVFFKGRNRKSNRVGHVALVVENKDGELTIMHSTNSRGIIKHKLKNNAYFQSRFLHLGRLPEVTKILNQDSLPHLSSQPKDSVN